MNYMFWILDKQIQKFQPEISNFFIPEGMPGS